MTVALFDRKREALRRSFEELLSEHLDALYRASLCFCRGHSADAEDLLQDAALRAFRGFSSLKDAGAGRSWLFTILLRTHLNRARSARRRAEVLVSDLTEQAFEAALERWEPLARPEVPEALLDEYLVGQRFMSVLSRLSEGFREVVWLIDVEEFRQREVAQMLELPEGTVASRLYRAREQLRNALAAHLRTRRRNDG